MVATLRRPRAGRKRPPERAIALRGLPRQLQGNTLFTRLPRRGPGNESSLTLPYSSLLRPDISRSPWEHHGRRLSGERVEPHCTAEVSRMEPAPMDHHEK